jgi:hypothetical protein
VTLQLAEEQFHPGDLDCNSARSSISWRPPKAKLRVVERRWPDLGALLAAYAVEDVSVEDPPLEEVIAELFSGRSERREGRREPACTSQRTLDHARASNLVDILRIALEERLVYRGDFALGTLMRFLPIVTQIFLWRAVFEAVVHGSAARRAEADTPSPASFDDIVAYYLLTMVSSSVLEHAGAGFGHRLQIRNGEIKKFLIQPVDLLGFLLLSRVAHKLAYYSVALGPFAWCFPLPRLLRGWLAGRH